MKTIENMKNRHTSYQKPSNSYHSRGNFVLLVNTVQEVHANLMWRGGGGKLTKDFHWYAQRD